MTYSQHCCDIDLCSTVHALDVLGDRVAVGQVLANIGVEDSLELVIESQQTHARNNYVLT